MIRIASITLAVILLGLPVSAAWPTLPPRNPWPQLPAKIEANNKNSSKPDDPAEPVGNSVENPFAAGTAANDSQRNLEKTIPQNPPAAASPSCPGGRCSQPRGIIFRRWR